MRRTIRNTLIVITLITAAYIVAMMTLVPEYGYKHNSWDEEKLTHGGM